MRSVFGHTVKVVTGVMLTPSCFLQEPATGTSNSCAAGVRCGVQTAGLQTYSRVRLANGKLLHVFS